MHQTNNKAAGSAAREHWASRVGFIMAAAGSAVGLGNIWRFPYLVGENGGGAFLVIYLALVATLGVSVLLAEVVIGRAAQTDPVGAFRTLGGRRWAFVGYLGIAAAFLILSFYGIVAGWTLAFAARSAVGALGRGQSEAAFAALTGDAFEPLLWAAMFMALTAFVVAGGIKGGIERANVILMPVLFLLLLVLAARAITLPGGMEGLRFFLAPDFSRVTIATIGAALGQAFFSLSIGLGTMITYGSYLAPRTPLPRSIGSVASLDTLAAMLAGCIVFPAVFAAGLDPSSGPGLAFVTLPTVFAEMPAGRLFGTGFFVLLAIAALTSSISLLEPVVAFLTDERGISRKKATLTAAAAAFLLGVPSSLSLGPVPSLSVFGMGFLDFVDHLTAAIMLPSGGVLIALFVGWVIGARAVGELTPAGAAPSAAARAWLQFVRWVAPPAIAWILISGLFGGG